MRNCGKCDVPMLSMVLTSDETTETVSWRCPSCGDVLIDMRQKEPEVVEEKEEKKRPSAGRKARDKHVKIHEEVWEMANDFVSNNKIMYPSIKFFTQQAIMEKIRREKGGGPF